MNPHDQRKKWRVVYSCLILFTVPILAAGLLCFHSVKGFQAQVIVSGSMKPHLPVNSLIIIRRLKPSEYRVGDVVSFRPPIPTKMSVTHRIVRLYRSTSGVPIMTTKGDANTNGDPWVTSLGAITGKEIFVLPGVGKIIEVIQTPLGFLCFASSTFIFCIMAELFAISRWLQGQRAANFM